MATTRRFAVVLAGLLTAACADGPTAPSPRAEPPLPPGANSAAAISSFVVTGQFTAGRYHYWPLLAIAAGSEAIKVSQVEFVRTGTTQRHVMTMSHSVAPGQVYTFSPELTSLTPAANIDVRVSFVDDRAQIGQVSATVAAPVLGAATSTALEITAFTVSSFMEGQ